MSENMIEILMASPLPDYIIVGQKTLVLIKIKIRFLGGITNLKRLYGQFSQ